MFVDYCHAWRNKQTWLHQWIFVRTKSLLSISQDWNESIQRKTTIWRSCDVLLNIISRKSIDDIQVFAYEISILCIDRSFWTSLWAIQRCWVNIKLPVNSCMWSSMFVWTMSLLIWKQNETQMAHADMTCYMSQPIEFLTYLIRHLPSIVNIFVIGRNLW
jgi:hypothetical protein